MKSLTDLYLNLSILRQTAYSSPKELADIVRAETETLQDIAHLTGKAQLNRFGQEVFDPDPIEVPVGFVSPTSEDAVVDAVMARIRRATVDPQFEGPDDAMDFDLEDAEPQSPYEDRADDVLFVKELISKAREIEARWAAVPPATDSKKTPEPPKELTSEAAAPIAPQKAGGDAA